MDFANVKSITIPEGNVKKITCGSVVLWESGGLPSEYQRVEWISDVIDGVAYIDLGFAFDKGAVIKTNFIAHNSSGHPFGSAENSGIYRCMISQTGSGNYTIYGSNGSAYIAEGMGSLGSEVNFVYTIKKNKCFVEELITGVKKENVITQIEYTMTNNLLLFAQNYNGTPRFAGTYSFKTFQYYDNDDNLICDLIPCYRKSDGVIGMYDVVRKIFLTNAGAGSFAKGADV